MQVRLACALAFGCLAASAPYLQAQSSSSLSQLLPRLLSEAVTMPSTVGGVAGNPHEAHFLPAAAQLEAPYALNGALVAQLATFPLGSSSGGFTYTSDAKTGIPTRSSSNFGPAFAERALTIGRGKFSAGFNYQHVRFQRFDGLDLEGGQIGFYLQHNDCCPGQSASTGSPGGGDGTLNPFFEGDLVNARLSLDARAETFAFFGNLGLTDRLDVGIAVPMVRVELDASITSTIDRLSTHDSPTIHSFGAGLETKVTSESGSASGLGDILVRAKYNFLQRSGGGLALGLDLRLPTGDKEDLLGTGATQTRLSLIYSGDHGRLSPHANVGYTFSSGSLSDALGTYQLGDQTSSSSVAPPGVFDNVFRGGQPPSTTITELSVPDEINYTLGFVFGVSPRVTFSFDAIGRTLRDVKRFGIGPATYAYKDGATGPIRSVTLDSLQISERSGNVNLLLGAAGVKLNVGGTLLVVANVLFPLNDQGLRAKVTPVIGIDYAF